MSTQKTDSLKERIEHTFSGGKGKTTNNAAHNKGKFLEDVTQEIFDSLQWKYRRTASKGLDGGRDFELPCQLFGSEPAYAYVGVPEKTSQITQRLQIHHSLAS